ncbi:MAG: hypothetical protein IPM57_09550 [Oligoflexia bacterium]|nr:hypothetical protein [Oligoflexia bacterium]
MMFYFLEVTQFILNTPLALRLIIRLLLIFRIYICKNRKGNLLLAEYVKRVNKKTFFNRYLAFLKPEHTVNVFNFEIDGVTTLRYHKDAISFSDATQEVDEFKKN